MNVDHAIQHNGTVQGKDTTLCGELLNFSCLVMFVMLMFWELFERAN